MANSEALISSVSAIIDKIIPDAGLRDQAKLELLRLESAREFKPLKTRISAILAESSARVQTQSQQPSSVASLPPSTVP